MRLGTVEAAVLRSAEEARERAMQRIEHDENVAALVQDLKAAADSYAHAAELLVLRMKAEAHAARAGRKAS